MQTVRTLPPSPPPALKIYVYSCNVLQILTLCATTYMRVNIDALPESFQRENRDEGDSDGSDDMICTTQKPHDT